MKEDLANVSVENRSGALPAASPRPGIRVWPAVLLLVVFWAFYVGIDLTSVTISTNFLSHAGATAILMLVFPLWWLTNGTVTGRERLWGFGAAVVTTVIAVFLTLSTLQPIGTLFFGIPVLFTVWTIWLVVSRNWSVGARSIGLLVAFGLAWTPSLLVRMDGLTGDLNPQISWRWSPTAEDKFLVKRLQDSHANPKPDEFTSEPLVLQPGDWPELRGPNRQGEVTGVRIDTDWKANPPKLVWRKDVGPAWSSMIVIGKRLFTQEQRGPQEAVMAIDADTGREIWSHENTTRFWDSQSGAGPRATPTFADGKLFVMGATGILDCLDAATGRLEWSRDVKSENDAPLPMWGYSCSPLVIEGRVIVYAGAPAPKGLVAYRAADGTLEWSAPVGPISYSSPQRIEIDGQPQVLFLSDEGLVAVQPKDGTMLWRHDAPSGGTWRVAQPRQVDGSDVLFGSEDLGLVRLTVTKRDDVWQNKERFTGKNLMKPAYNDFEIFDNVAYGFDGNIFCAVDLDGGKRLWKAGRYGHGQAMALVEQRLIVVVTEEGEVVLLAANPKASEELGRFKAIEGKTWNHPAIAHGRLFVRNDVEMACYELALAMP